LKLKCIQCRKIHDIVVNAMAAAEVTTSDWLFVVKCFWDGHLFINPYHLISPHLGFGFFILDIGMPNYCSQSSSPPYCLSQVNFILDLDMPTTCS
jgi:hypothetical protein